MGDIKSLLIMGLIFVGILTSVTTFYGSLLGNYDVTIPSGNKNITELEDTFNSIRSQADQFSSTIQKEGPTQETGILYTITTGTYNTLVLLFTSTSTFVNIISNLGHVAGIPYPFPELLITIVFVIITFAILKGVLKVDL